jgi:hypothetical protein
MGIDFLPWPSGNHNKSTGFSRLAMMISSGRLKDDGSGTIGYEDLGAFLGLISRISP